MSATTVIITHNNNNNNNNKAIIVLSAAGNRVGHFYFICIMENKYYAHAAITAKGHFDPHFKLLSFRYNNHSYDY